MRKFLVSPNSTVLRSFRVLTPKERLRIYQVGALQIALAILDLVGIALIGLLGALAFSGVSGNPTGRAEGVLNFLRLDGATFQMQVAMLGILATLFLVARSLFSIAISRIILLFLSRRAARLSSETVEKLLSQSLLVVRQRTTPMIVFAVTDGITAVTMGIIAPAVALVTDGFLLLTMFFALFFVNPIIAFSTFVILGSVALLLNSILSVQAKELGGQLAKSSIASNEKIYEVMASYREAVIRNRRHHYSKEIENYRYAMAESLGGMSFMPYASKYIIETTFVVGAVIICAIQFLILDAQHAVATLSIFLAAGMRIAPAFMRAQQSVLTIKNNIGSAIPALDLIDSVSVMQPAWSGQVENDFIHEDFEPSIVVSNLNFAYPNTSGNALSEISFSVNEGDFIAIVGSSGAGKSTLIDVLLGIFPPTSGSVKISGMEPLQAVAKWPGSISYVPQNVEISNGTIKGNVALGYSNHEIIEERVWGALEISQMGDVVRGLPEGIDEMVGERGTRISGGQRQRLGIARAMYTNPKLLVLDEATSALDGKTESDFTDAIQGILHKTTVLVIAHRLSTVKHADRIIYMKDGKIEFIGDFDSLRHSIPEFDEQANLMGL